MVLRAGLQSLDRVAGENAAAVDECDPVAQLRLVHNVRCDDDGLAARLELIKIGCQMRRRKSGSIPTVGSSRMRRLGSAISATAKDNRFSHTARIFSGLFLSVSRKVDELEHLERSFIQLVF